MTKSEYIMEWCTKKGIQFEVLDMNSKDLDFSGVPKQNLDIYDYIDEVCETKNLELK